MPAMAYILGSFSKRMHSSISCTMGLMSNVSFSTSPPRLFWPQNGPRYRSCHLKGQKSLRLLEKSRFCAQGPFRILEMAHLVIFKGWGSPTGNKPLQPILNSNRTQHQHQENNSTLYQHPAQSHPRPKRDGNRNSGELQTPRPLPG